MLKQGLSYKKMFLYKKRSLIIYVLFIKHRLVIYKNKFSHKKQIVPVKKVLLKNKIFYIKYTLFL